MEALTCAGRTIEGNPCLGDPCATAHLGPLMDCQAVEGMDVDRYVNMRVCPEHVTPFVGMESVWLCCEAVPMTLRWDGGRISVPPCPTCQGSLRETVGMVCQTCGRDYS